MSSYIQIFCCAILWGFSGPMIRWSHLPPTSISSIRLTLPLFLAYGTLRWIEKRKLSPINSSLALASLLSALGNGFYISSFTFTSISNVLLLLYTRPVMATLLGCLMLGERVSVRLWCLLGIAFSGALLIICAHDLEFSNSDLLGMLLALGAAFTTALAWTVIKMRGYQERSASEILFYQHLLGAIIALPLLPSVIMSAPADGIAISCLYASLIGFLATLMYFKGQQHIKLSSAMPLTYAELVVAVFLGVIVFGDHLSPLQIAGGILIVASSLFTILEKKK